MLMMYAARQACVHCCSALRCRCHIHLRWMHGTKLLEVSTYKYAVTGTPVDHGSSQHLEFSLCTAVTSSWQERRYIVAFRRCTTLLGGRFNARALNQKETAGLSMQFHRMSRPHGQHNPSIISTAMQKVFLREFTRVFTIHMADFPVRMR